MRLHGWLEDALGSPGRVRVLRYLVRSVRTEHSLSDIARAVGLGYSSTRVALFALAEQGLVGVRALGNVSVVSIHRGTVRSMIKRIFELEAAVDAEASRRIRAAVPAGTSVCLFGSAARHEQKKTSDLDILVVAPTKVQAEDAALKVQDAILQVGPLRPRVIAFSGKTFRSRWEMDWVKSVRAEGILLAGPELKMWL